MFVSTKEKYSNETLKELYVQLNNLASNCNFGTAYDSRLRDQLFLAIDD